MTRIQPTSDRQNSQENNSANRDSSLRQKSSTSNLSHDRSSSQEQSNSPDNIIDSSKKKSKKLPEGRPLGKQLLFYLLPTVLVPMGLAGFVGYKVIQENAEKRIKMQSSDRAILASKVASDLLEEAFKFPTIIASNPLVIEAVKTGSQKVEEEKLNQRSKEQLENNYSRTRLISPNQKLNDYLRAIAKLNGVPKILITERHGLNIAYNRTARKFVQTDEDWWVNADEKRNWVSPPNENESVGITTIHLSRKITDPSSGEFLGVIKYSLPTSTFDILTRYLMRTGIKDSQTQQVQLFDSKGGDPILTVKKSGSFHSSQVTGRPKINQISQDLVKLYELNLAVDSEKKEKNIKDLENIWQKDNQIKEIKIERILDNDRDSKDRGLIASFFLEKRLYKMATVPGTNWVSVASIDKVEIVSAGKELIYIFSSAALLLAILAVGMILILARKLSAPLGKLAQKAEQIAAGNLEVRAEPGDTKETQTLAQSFNNLVAQLKSLLQQQVSETKQSRLLAEISSSPTTNKQDGQNILNLSLDGAREILQVERMVIYRLYSDGSGYIANESVAEDWQNGLNYEIKDPCIPQNLLEEYLQGRVAATADVKKANFHPDHLQLMEKLQIKANLVVPIIDRGKLYGLIIAHHCAKTHEWQEREINFTKQLAGQLGLILERVAFIQERQEETARSECLKEITLKISGALKAEDILETAVGESRQLLKADRVVIDSFDGVRKGTVIAESVGENWPRALGAEITDPGFINQFVERYRRAEVEAINDIYKANLSEFHLKQLEPFSVKAKLVTPILMGGELRGFLIAHQCSGPRKWEQSNIDFLSQVATQVGLALERANLLEQQRDAREYLQERALELLREVDPVSKGDLTIRARVTEDEIGTVAYSYNSTIESLQKIVNQVQSASRQVATTTNNNQASVQALSTGAQKQRREIEAAREQIQAMANSIAAVAANAEQAETMVRQANETVEAGEEAMNRTVEGIMAICDTVAETADKVKQLGDSSQKISKVVNLISRFAAQTNLLALKTSIEAARAGEQGRGFAVIADEIRSLAAQSAEATAEIKKLIAAIQTETNDVVAAMEAGTSQVISGTKLVDETRSSLDKIALVSAQISQLVKEIATAALEQAQTSDTVNKRIAEVAAISNQTSAEAQQVSHSFKELLKVADELQDSVDRFKLSQ
ncbi:MAG: methyl-accepting chemotaxis protein [Prochloraceae cyanobacterium]|nr:methyl-accepting chemotaxis protein [Prochloraceae cyanobacterium]